ncbi:MAG: hypothetical protein J5755_04095 [Clostridia bacterium]|nr:hypothetical protein [Clostridia bacterium]
MDQDALVTRLGVVLGRALPPSAELGLVEVGDRLVWEGFDRPRDLPLWVRGWIDAYFLLVEDGVIEEGETIDVVVSAQDPLAALAAIMAQKEGLPLYTVILADEEDGEVYRYSRGLGPCPPGWEALAGGRWQERYPDVVVGWADPESMAEAIVEAYESEDYLLHPHTAMAWAVTDVYWEEAEHDRVTLVLAAKHPYEAASEVWEILSGDKLPQDEAVKQLYLDSGWEYPA